MTVKYQIEFVIAKRSQNGTRVAKYHHRLASHSCRVSGKSYGRYVMMNHCDPSYVIPLGRIQIVLKFRLQRDKLIPFDNASCCVKISAPRILVRVAREELVHGSGS